MYAFSPLGNKNVLFTVMLLFFVHAGTAESGYRLWLRYDLIPDAKLRREYQQLLNALLVDGDSPTLSAARQELITGLTGLLGAGPSLVNSGQYSSNLLVCGRFNSPAVRDLKIPEPPLGAEGYVIRTKPVAKKTVIVIAAQTDIGVLYGTFHFLRLLQTNKTLNNLDIQSIPRISLRMLNHWDNLDRTVERGYAGFSLWDWQKLPGYIDPRYEDYARANASIGINATALTNVNANALILTPDYLRKVAALADVFRPYGIKVFLTARFNAPMELGKFSTADPLDPKVQQWWKEKAKEIYQYVPDFGGFLVKANSEGQPGPQNYSRTHADGANMLADVVGPFKGIVIWRAFVYDDKVPDDRAKQAYNEFKPLDGQFRDNVVVQVKNGPVDFQPREPFHPLFGAMPKTPLSLEFQITQEYLGFSSHLVYLAPLFNECLQSDTYAQGQGSTVASVVDGTLEKHALSVIAGVANTGTDFNWCGHPFAQSNWYAFGRLAWDHGLTPGQIAEEWIRMTFSNQKQTVESIYAMMMSSREITVNYMTPLGLHHIMGWSHHYGPAPWIKDKERADWTSVYYHKADSTGIGFDRTVSGSGAASQYFHPVRDQFESVEACPENLLLWFHHLSWNYKTRSGQTLWDDLCRHYYTGADSAKWMQGVWNSVQGAIDPERFEQVKMLLDIQADEAKWWRDACVLYFQTFSRKPLPPGLEKPTQSLDYFMKLSYPFAPGIRPQWR